MKYHAPAPSPVTKKPTNYDTFPLLVLDGKYQPHKDSGRWKCLQKITDKMTFAAWTTACAKEGFDTDFCLKALQKHEEKDNPVYKFAEKNPEGKTYKEVKAAIAAASKPQKGQATGPAKPPAKVKKAA